MKQKVARECARRGREGGKEGGREGGRGRPGDRRMGDSVHAGLSRQVGDQRRKRKRGRQAERSTAALSVA